MKRTKQNIVSKVRTNTCMKSWIGALTLTILICTGARGATSLVVAGFSYARSGEVSFTSGAYFSEAKAAVATNFVNVSFTNLDVLTLSNLADVDLLILAPGTTHNTDATPLSTNEQAALFGYVQNGGGLLLLADNYSYASYATDEETALLSPFGMSGFGTTAGGTLATVIAPGADPLSGGPFGKVTTFTQNFAGGITNLGPYAVALASNYLGVAMAEISPGKLGPASGPVAVFSDGNTWSNEGNGAGFFTANETLFLNTLSWARRGGGLPLLGINQQAGKAAINWPAWALGFNLEFTTNLNSRSSWKSVTQIPVQIGLQNFLTNAMLGNALFYRLHKP